ncbi:MAG: hypothetical protein U0T81_14475 [Saprospiraceae bacterium]
MTDPKTAVWVPADVRFPELARNRIRSFSHIDDDQAICSIIQPYIQIRHKKILLRQVVVVPVNLNLSFGFDGSSRLYNTTDVRLPEYCVLRTMLFIKIMLVDLLPSSGAGHGLQASYSGRHPCAFKIKQVMLRLNINKLRNFIGQVI